MPGHREYESLKIPWEHPVDIAGVHLQEEFGP